MNGAFKFFFKCQQNIIVLTENGSVCITRSITFRIDRMSVVDTAGNREISDSVDCVARWGQAAAYGIVDYTTVLVMPVVEVIGRRWRISRCRHASIISPWRNAQIRRLQNRVLAIWSHTEQR